MTELDRGRKTEVSLFLNKAVLIMHFSIFLRQTKACERGERADDVTRKPSSAVGQVNHRN